MPIYEYVCRSCGNKFELMRNISDSDREIKCPKCGADNPRRVLSSFSTAGGGGSCSPSSTT